MRCEEMPGGWGGGKGGIKGKTAFFAAAGLAARWVGRGTVRNGVGRGEKVRRD